MHLCGKVNGNSGHLSTKESCFLKLAASIGAFTGEKLDKQPAPEGMSTDNLPICITKTHPIICNDQHGTATRN